MRTKETLPSAEPVTRLLPEGLSGVATVAKFFRALGDPTRLRLLEFLLHEEHTVSECVAHVGLSQGRVSTHLACLHDCGYVQARRAGRRTYYVVADPRVGDLVVLGHALAADNCSALTACVRIDAAGKAAPAPAERRPASGRP
jgi:ArsR family transcriptional regulator, cadmium/lead-responsive transcriptional repressor